MADLFNSSSAVLSHCGLYRYRLDRRWAPGPVMGFIMLNPSTADASQDDPTIRRCVGFAKREACGGLVVINLYPLRATKPADLWAKDSPTRIGGPRGEVEFHRAVGDADILLAAWGADTRGVEHWIVQRYGPQMQCLGKTKAGQPRHPLYVKCDAPLEPLLPHSRTAQETSEAP